MEGGKQQQQQNKTKNNQKQTKQLQRTNKQKQTNNNNKTRSVHAYTQLHPTVAVILSNTPTGNWNSQLAIKSHDHSIVIIIIVNKSDNSSHLELQAAAVLQTTKTTQSGQRSEQVFSEKGLKDLNEETK